MATTRALIYMVRSSPSLRRLCGWDSVAEIPDESVFSRAFALFSEMELPQRVHEALVKEQYQAKICGHVSRDATVIKGCEKPKPESKGKKTAKKRGRPRKGGRHEKSEPRRLGLQAHSSLGENLEDLPSFYDVGCKKNSKFYKESWVGYKLHLDVVDGDIPISGVLATASLHDSQAAIPLAKMSAGPVSSLYDLMDAAYAAGEIHEFSRSLRHVPVIDDNPRRK